MVTETLLSGAENVFGAVSNFLYEQLDLSEEDDDTVEKEGDPEDDLEGGYDIGELLDDDIGENRFPIQDIHLDTGAQFQEDVRVVRAPSSRRRRSESNNRRHDQKNTHTYSNRQSRSHGASQDKYIRSISKSRGRSKTGSRSDAIGDQISNSQQTNERTYNSWAKRVEASQAKKGIFAAPPIKEIEIVRGSSQDPTSAKENDSAVRGRDKSVDSPARSKSRGRSHSRGRRLFQRREQTINRRRSKSVRKYRRESCRGRSLSVKNRRAAGEKKKIAPPSRIESDRPEKMTKSELKSIIDATNLMMESKVEEVSESKGAELSTMLPAPLTNKAIHSSDRLKNTKRQEVTRPQKQKTHPKPTRKGFFSRFQRGQIKPQNPPLDALEPSRLPPSLPKAPKTQNNRHNGHTNSLDTRDLNSIMAIARDKLESLSLDEYRDTPASTSRYDMLASSMEDILERQDENPELPSKDSQEILDATKEERDPPPDVVQNESVPIAVPEPHILSFLANLFSNQELGESQQRTAAKSMTLISETSEHLDRDEISIVEELILDKHFATRRSSAPRGDRNKPAVTKNLRMVFHQDPLVEYLDDPE